MRTFILKSYKGQDQCPYCGSGLPKGFEKEVKTIELEPLLDLLENTRPDSADDLVHTVENLCAKIED